MKKFCEIQDIDLESFLKYRFVKFTNRDNPNKSHKETSLEDLLAKPKYRINNQNQRSQEHAKKIAAFPFSN